MSLRSRSAIFDHLTLAKLSSLSFANLLAMCRRMSILSGWSRPRGDRGRGRPRVRVIASGRTRFRRAGKGMAIHVAAGMTEIGRAQAARRSLRRCRPVLRQPLVRAPMGCRSWVDGQDQGRDRGRERLRRARDRVGANAVLSRRQRNGRLYRRRHGGQLSRSCRSALAAVMQAAHFR